VPIQVGIAAGQLTVGDHHGGAGEQLAAEMAALVAAARATDDFETAVRRAAIQKVTTARESSSPVHGFGHPQHGADPRVRVLRSIAEREGVA
ncbi:hypothetical protein WB472_46705, partial [Streptomyces brasiliscabiei]